MPTDVAEAETRIFNDLGTAIAVLTAHECGLLDQLSRGPAERGNLALPPFQGEVLVALLVRAELVEWSGDSLLPAPAFRHLIGADRVDIIARLEFTLMAASDMITGRQAFFSDRSRFMGASATYGFYCYDRALKTGPGHLQDTAPWVAHVSALSRLEAPDLLTKIDLSSHRQVLEIGGNDGTFARAALGVFQHLDWTVLDLPAVCALGRQKGAGPTFVPGDARTEPWPEADVVLFKSVLHDWSDEAAAQMLAQAAAHVPQGGRVVIIERGPVAEGGLLGNLSAAANLVFAPFYRSPAWYREHLTALGLTVGAPKTVPLDLPFHIVEGVRE